MDYFPSRKLKHEDISPYSTLSVHPQLENYAGPLKHTKHPIVTGTTVLGIHYKDGIMLAADDIGNYGSLARFRNVQRLHTLGEFTLLAASGDLSDYQYTKHMLDTLITKEHYMNDGHVLGTAHLYEYLSRVMYHRRSEINPLWNAFIVGGLQNGERFLGYVDLLGVTYQATTVATGIGAYLVSPLLRKKVEGREDVITEAEAIEIVNECMRFLYYTDSRACNKYHRGKITAQGVEISEQITIDTEWSFGLDIWNRSD